MKAVIYQARLGGRLGGKVTVEVTDGEKNVAMFFLEEVTVRFENPYSGEEYGRSFEELKQAERVCNELQTQLIVLNKWKEAI